METLPNPNEIRAKRVWLETECQKTREVYEEAGRKLISLDRQIRELQNTCPHDHKSKQLVSDVAEMKPREICEDCGGEVRRFEPIHRRAISAV